MPSPAGHALAGLAAGWLIAGAPAWPPPIVSMRRRRRAPAPDDAAARGAAAAANAGSAGAAGDGATGASARGDLAGVAARGGPWIASWRGAVLLATLGALPDVDLLFHAHSMYTHSVGAALVVLLAALALTPVPAHRVVTALACGAAYGTHTLLDWLGNDTTPPIGIMALWPFTSGYYESDVHWFMAITRRYWLPNFYTHNLQAVARELGTLVPLAALIYAIRRRRA